jgi:pyruvate/2-oxoacid:ferredoxin oxidoreductase alpha subunit
MKRLLTGNESAAAAVKLSQPQVIAAYPITPQTSIAEKLAEAVARGELESRYMKVESETAAMAACIGASMAGARTFTATSSQGLALMHELLHWASGARLPIVLVNVNRSMASPWSLGVDQNDSLSQRDTGWMQLYCETGQEVLDSILIAFRLAEQTEIPVMVAMDGFLLSHYFEPVDVPFQEEVDRFLPRRKARFRLDPKHPATFGGGVSSGVLYDLRRKFQADMEQAGEHYRKLSVRFSRAFGRSYRSVETFQTEGSDLTLITSGTLAGTVKAFLKQNTQRPKVGLVKVRMFRPFPGEEIRQALKGLKQVAILDRNLSPGSGGIFSQEIKASLLGMERAPSVVSVVGGLGGVDITPAHIERLVGDLLGGKGSRFETLWIEA